MAQTDVALAELPTSVSSVVQSEEGTIDRILTWELDFAGDPTPDLVVQAAFAIGGGNMVVLAHYLFESRKQGYVLAGRPELPGGIKAAARKDDALELRLYRYLDGDGRCCPSGEEIVLIRP